MALGLHTKPTRSPSGLFLYIDDAKGHSLLDSRKEGVALREFGRGDSDQKVSRVAERLQVAPVGLVPKVGLELRPKPEVRLNIALLGFR